MKLKGSLILITMIVIAIIAIAAAIAIPALLQQRPPAPQAEFDEGNAAPNPDAQTMLVRIVTAQANYVMRNKRYAPTLATLVESGLLKNEELSVCTAAGIDSKALNGYVFQMTTGRTWTSTSFYVRCKPVSGNGECYSVDVCGKIVTTAKF